MKPQTAHKTARYQNRLKPYLNVPETATRNTLHPQICYIEETYLKISYIDVIFNLLSFHFRTKAQKNKIHNRANDEVKKSHPGGSPETKKAIYSLI